MYVTTKIQHNEHFVHGLF